MKKTALLLLISFIFLTTLQSQDILPPVLPWSGKSEALIVKKKNPWITPSEVSGLTETPDYKTTMAWLSKLVEASPLLSMRSIGMSEQGRPIQMIIASKEGKFEASDIVNSPKPAFLFHAGIHSGEIDGKDAGMMLLRDIAMGKKKALLDDVNLLFIPILNVDGHERKSEYTRVNQRGPKVMGWRTNAQNLNLNRDFTKIETAGVQAVIQVINDYDPELYVDLHVTDGADYQYDITYGFAEKSSYSPTITKWLSEELKPKVDDALQENGHIPGPLMFAKNDRDFTEGNTEYAFSPRYSDSYGNLRHVPSILVENHSLKPYNQRVLGTYVFLEAAINVLASKGPLLNEMIENDLKLRPDSLTLAYEEAEGPPDSMQLEGIKSVLVKSKYTHTEYVQWTGQTTTETIANIKISKASTKVKVPSAYWVPAEWSEVIEKLQHHGVEMETLTTTQTKTVNQYFLTSYKVGEPYEGRVRLEDIKTESISREVTYYPGSVRIPTDQPLGELVVALLEPSAPDGFLQWGYFLPILSQTEYIEAYVIEPLIGKMLSEDPDLKARFESKMKTDSAFAKSPKSIYEWFYAQTPYYDQEWKVVPIGVE
ncbi:M14 family metallopeptidase [Marinoscillum sp. MHG1-6]|uniref:M14 family metallopeptidase n=1 Tax=Marinoscillum sp. MHG1-6 TaxID=2959627 RepID=UPI0021570C6D|nr:M14 family metallopeptidase [Marinoscillum sp. MHG1-6]